MIFIYFNQLSTLLFCIVLLNSCTVGPDFKSPQSPATQTFIYKNGDGRHVDQTVVQSQLPDPLWWQVFQVSDLNEVMSLALENNNTLEIAQATLDQTKEELRAVRGSSFWPELSLEGSVGRQKFGVAELGPGDITIPAFTSYTLGPKISYLLDFAGGERRSIEQQSALVEAQQYRCTAVRLSIIGQVIDQALAMASAKEQLAILADILIDDQKNKELVDVSRKAGSATETDVLSVRSQFASDQALLSPLRQQLSMSEHALSLMVGKAPADWRPPDFSLNAFSLPKRLPLSLPSELVRLRPDIRAAEAQLHAATAAIGVAEAQLYPSIILNADTLQESLTARTLFDGSNNSFALGARLSAPIFKGGSLLAKKHAAEQACRAARAHYQQVVLTAFGQVADVLKAIEHDTEQLDAQRLALETARESLRLARLSYSAGNVGVLQVLDAERLSNQARLGFAKAKVRQFQDTALLYLALGGAAFSKERTTQ